MNPESRLQQRELDGVLPRDQVAALAVLTAEQPNLAAQATALLGLDADLRHLAAPLRQLNHDLHVRATIMQRVANRVPVPHLRLRPLDLVYAAAVAVLAIATYGLAGAAVRTLFEQAVVMTWVIGLSLMLGLLLMIAPGFLRQAESGFLAALMRRPVAIGPADVVIYRAVGVVLVIGGIWLTY